MGSKKTAHHIQKSTEQARNAEQQLQQPVKNSAPLASLQESTQEPKIQEISPQPNLTEIEKTAQEIAQKHVRD